MTSMKLIGKDLFTGHCPQVQTARIIDYPYGPVLAADFAEASGPAADCDFDSDCGSGSAVVAAFDFAAALADPVFAGLASVAGRLVSADPAFDSAAGCDYRRRPAAFVAAGDFAAADAAFVAAVVLADFEFVQSPILPRPPQWNFQTNPRHGPRSDAVDGLPAFQTKAWCR